MKSFYFKSVQMWQSIASIYAHFLMHAFSMSIRCKEAVLVCMHVHVCIICLMRSVISDHSTSCIQHYLNCCQQYYYHIVLCAAHFGLLMAAILNSAVARVWLSFYCCAITNKVASCCFSHLLAVSYLAIEFVCSSHCSKLLSHLFAISWFLYLWY